MRRTWRVRRRVLLRILKVRHGRRVLDEGIGFAMGHDLTDLGFKVGSSYTVMADTMLWLLDVDIKS